MARFRKRDRRRPAAGTRSGGQQALWVPTGLTTAGYNELVFTGTVTGPASGGGLYEMINWQDLGYPIGTTIQVGGIFAQAGGLVFEAEDVRLIDAQTIRASFSTSVSLGESTIVIPSFSLVLLAGAGWNCAGAVATLP